MKTRLRRVIGCLLSAICLFIGLLGSVSCSGRISFQDGENISILLDETRYLRVSHAKKTLRLESSDESVISVDKNGYIYGVSCGSAIVSVYSGEKKKDSINVFVARPEVPKENIYVGKVELDKHTNAYLKLNEDVQKGDKIYAYAKKDGELLGESFSYATGYYECYFYLDDLGITEDGIIEFGFAWMENLTANPIEKARVTDRAFAYGLNGKEDLLSYLLEPTDKGWAIMSSVENHAGIQMTFAVKTDKDGNFINRYIVVPVISGFMWSLKIRVGDGTIGTTDFSITGDVRIYEKREYLVDLRDYSEYVKDGCVTIVIYAIEETLKLGEIVNYCNGNDALDMINISKIKGE